MRAMSWGFEESKRPQGAPFGRLTLALGFLRTSRLARNETPPGEEKHDQLFQLQMLISEVEPESHRWRWASVTTPPRIVIGVSPEVFSLTGGPRGSPRFEQRCERTRNARTTNTPAPPRHVRQRASGAVACAIGEASAAGLSISVSRWQMKSVRSSLTGAL